MTKSDAQTVLEALERLAHEEFPAIGFRQDVAKQALPAAQRLVGAEQPVDKPLHVITRAGCSICGTDALHCSFWKTYKATKALKLNAEDKALFTQIVTARTWVAGYPTASAFEDALKALDDLLKHFKITRIEGNQP
jgi:hypothetical protein